MYAWSGFFAGLTTDRSRNRMRMTMTAFKDGVGPNNIFADGSVVSLGLKERPGCEDGLGAGFGKQTWPS